MFYGVDTSCYTTSLAALDSQGRLLGDERQLLPVKSGSRGLRQSESVFYHVRQLPVLAEKLAAQTGPLSLRAVAASDRPRPAEGSYMPVFSVGSSFGRVLAAAAGVPCRTLSHQEGHILAGLWSAEKQWADFYALHVSGGTTEMLDVRLEERLDVRKLGGSADLSAGLFIDRVGVSLGLPFPAGPALENLAQTCEGGMLTVPAANTAAGLSFSGPESHVQRAIAAKKYPPQAVARGVEHCVAQSLARYIERILADHGAKPVLFVGGVMANNYIKSYLLRRLGGEAAFAGARFAGDNAVGAAQYARLCGLGLLK